MEHSSGATSLPRTWCYKSGPEPNTTRSQRSRNQFGRHRTNAGQKQDLQNKFNLQRQEEIKKDTDKLLQLATELKQSVDKSSQNTLSLDVIKKAEQIEKLAKTVKDKMKGP